MQIFIKIVVCVFLISLLHGNDTALVLKTFDNPPWFYV